MGANIQGIRIPIQLEFKPLREEFGVYKLEDGCIIKARVILADVHMVGEDAVGPQLVYSVTVAIRFIVPDDVRRRVADRPLATFVDARDLGWRPVKVLESNPAYSEYILDGKWLMKLRLEIVGVVKNENYRNEVLMPHYMARWVPIAYVERLPPGGPEKVSGELQG